MCGPSGTHGQRRQALELLVRDLDARRALPIAMGFWKSCLNSLSLFSVNGESAFKGSHALILHKGSSRELHLAA